MHLITINSKHLITFFRINLFFNFRKHVVFGKVIQGFEIIRYIENLPTDDKNKPDTNVSISHCGELVLKAKSKLQYLIM